MITHLVDVQRRRAKPSVCGLTYHHGLVTTSTESLLACEAPCVKCLEWVVEKGQQATQRLLDLSQPKEPHL
jgi:hypothetical protein